MDFNLNDNDNEINGEYGSELKKKKKTQIPVRTAKIMLVGATALAFVAAAAYGALLMIFDGPSDGAREAFAAYADKSDIKLVKMIASSFGSVAEASDTAPEVYANSGSLRMPENKKATAFPIIDGEHELIKSDVDRKFTDGLRLDTVKKEKYKAKVLLIKDPSRVFVAVSGDFASNEPGMYIEDVCEKQNLAAAVNGGADKSGGNLPGGLVISEGRLLYGGGAAYDSVVGLTQDGVLTFGELKASGDEQELRDALSVDRVLISGGEIVYKPNSEVVTSADLPNPRTAVGQLEDGTIMLVCVDGRSADSLGASLGELCGLFAEYKAVTAANLGGGASSAMVYGGELVSKPSNLYGTKKLPTFIGVREVAADE